MAVRRKVFRIERGGDQSTVSAGTSEGTEELLAEIKALRSRLEQAHADERGSKAATDTRGRSGEAEKVDAALATTKREIAYLYPAGLPGGEMARIVGELDAIVREAERSMQHILAAAEDIDEAADTLSAAVKQEHGRGLVKDIQDHVARVYEACNFHDLAGQRIANVLVALRAIDGRIGRVKDSCAGIGIVPSRPAANGGEIVAHGPKLEGEPGHATQAEIDALFASA
jgi:chemotaxis protein CheZ